MQPRVTGWPRQLCLALVLTMGPAAAALAQEPAADPAEPAPSPVPNRLIQSITITPSVAFSGSNMRVVVRVVPDAGNRRLQMAVDAPHFYASTERQLDGTDGARAHTFNLYELPAGDYELTAILEGADGIRSKLTRQFKVMGEIDDGQPVDPLPTQRGRRGRARP